MVSRKNKRTALYATPETRSRKGNNNHMFTMKISGVGEVPMMFYIPDERARDKLRPQIEQHGGIVVEQYEAYVYQIKPTRGLRSGSCSNIEQFYVGYVYNSQWITESLKKHKLLDEEKFLCGFNKTSKLRIIKPREKRQYTISEVLRIFDLVEEEGGSAKKIPPMKFWSEIDIKNYVPDRSAASLRTAYKKFSVSTRRAFVKAALKKSSTRFSHQFEDVPEAVVSTVPISTQKKSKKDSCVRNLGKLMNSASTKISPTKIEPEVLEPSPEITPQVDLNVMTNQPSIIGQGEEMEFVLEVEDMQSAISNHFAGDSSYNIKPTRKRHRNEYLDEMYSGHDSNMGHKRIKLEEADSKAFEYNECDTTIYDQDSLMDHIEKEAKIKITSNVESGERVIQSKISNSDTYFQKITEELDSLCGIYNLTMDEMHALFMSACCDMEELKKILINDHKNQQEWNHLEDLAASSDPGSEEYNYIVKSKGEEAVEKRRQFLEIQKNM